MILLPPDLLMVLTTRGQTVIGAEVRACTLTSAVISGLTIETEDAMLPGSMMLAPSASSAVPPRFTAPLMLMPLPIALCCTDTFRSVYAGLFWVRPEDRRCRAWQHLQQLRRVATYQSQVVDLFGVQDAGALSAIRGNHFAAALTVTVVVQSPLSG